MNHEKYYQKNKKYLKILEKQDRSFFIKYSDYVVKYTKNGDKVLDVGCGSGIAIEITQKKANRDLYGIDIAQESIHACKKKLLNCVLYDGNKIPFKKNYFDFVGSINVLEHTDDPVNFLNQQVDVLKKGGYILISCPNFLSISNNYHHHTRGYIQKSKNILSILRRVIVRKVRFEKMMTIDREDFQPDDDACNITNPLDILWWSKSRNLTLVYWSSQPFYSKGTQKVLDRGIFKLFLGSSFMVMRK